MEIGISRKTLLALALTAQTAAWADFEYEGINYNELNDTTVEVATNHYTGGDIVIPQQVKKGDKSMTVVAVGRYAFACYSEPTLTSITLPETVTTIGENAFYRQAKLTELPLGDNITQVGDYAFSGTGVKELVLSHVCWDRGMSLFSDCRELTSITLPEGMEVLPESFVSGCKSLKEVRLPASLRRIGQSAFSRCSALESISLPDGLQEIENSVFFQCSSLKSISLPEGLQRLEGSVFYGCSALEAANVPAGIKRLPSNCFEDCTSLCRFTIPGTVEEMEYGVFRGCTALEQVTMPDCKLASIPSYTFQNCKSLKELPLPESIEGIGNEAFDGSGLRSITIDHPLSTDYNAFSNCYDLMDVYVETLMIGDQWGMKYIPREAFGNATYFFGTLHVPEGKRNYLQQQSECWRQFRNVVETNTSGKTYCSVNIKCPSMFYLLVNGQETDGQELHDEMEEGSRLTIGLDSEKMQLSSWTRWLISGITVNGKDMSQSISDNTFVIDRVSEDMDIEVELTSFNAELAIYQNGNGSFNLLLGNNSIVRAIIMPAQGYWATAKWGPWHKTSQVETAWYESFDVYGKKTIEVYGGMYNDHELNINYQKK